MKKTIIGLFLAITAILSTTLQAQTCEPCLDEKFTNYKVGQNSLEVGLLQGNSSGLLSTPQGMIRHRVYVSNQLALRSSVLLSGNKINSNPLESYYQQSTHIVSNSQLGLTIGIQKHFSETYKFSPYFGADLVYSHRNNKTKTENVYNNTFVPNYKFKQVNNLGMIGARGFIGADYFLNRSIYVGGEVGIGINTTLYDNNKTESAHLGFIQPQKTKNGRITEYGTFFYGAKLGFRF